MIEVGILQKTANLIENYNDKDKVRTLINDLIVNGFKFPVVGTFIVSDGYAIRPLVSGSDHIMKFALKVLGTKFEQLTFNYTEYNNYFKKTHDSKKPLIVDTVKGFIPGLEFDLSGIETKLDLIKSLYGISEIGVFPCFYRGGLKAYIVVGHKDKFQKEEIDALSVIANQLAGYLSFADLTESLESRNLALAQHNIYLQSLYNLTSHLRTSIDPQQIAQEAVNVLSQDEFIIGSLISRYDEKAGTITVMAVTENSISSAVHKLIGDFDKYPVDINDPIYATNPAVLAIQTGEVQYVEDLKTYLSPPVPGKFVPQISKILNIKSIVIHPVYTRNKVFGTMSFFLTKNTYEELDENQKKLLTSYTEQIGIALDNAQLFEDKREQLKKTEQRYDQLQIVQEVTTKMLHSLDTGKIAETIVNNIAEKLNYSIIALAFYDPERHTLRARTMSDTPLTRLAEKIMGKSFYDLEVDVNDPHMNTIAPVQSFNEGRVIVSNDFADAVSPVIPKVIAKQMQEKFGIKSLVNIPIKSEGVVKGVIVGTVVYEITDEILDQQKELLETLAAQAGIALQNAKLFEERKEALEQLEEKVQALEDVRRKERDMIDILGHELRTPVSIIKVNHELISRYWDKAGVMLPQDVLEKFNKSEKRIHEAVQRESKLIDILLSATKLDAKRLSLNMEKADIVDMVGSSIDAYTEKAQNKGLQLEFVEQEVAGKCPLVYADKVRLQEVIDNLVDNAIKYTEKGKVTVSAKCVKDFVTVSVADTGPGIPKDALPHLGEKFFRVEQYIGGDKDDKIDVVRPGGTGLGLYVSFGIIEAHGGTMKVESEVGKGTTFIFTVPVYKDQVSSVKEGEGKDLFTKLGLKKVHNE